MKPCEIDFKVEETKIDFKSSDESINFKTNEQIVVSPITSYSLLTDKPQVNFKVLESGNNTLEYLGVQETINDITEQDIDNLIYGG